MSIADISTLAQFAQASYVTLGDGDAGATLSAKLQTPTGGLAATQAEQFATKYSVVLQYDDRSAGGNNTGLSLTVFKDTSTNQLTLAIRGTTASDPNDLATDGSIFINGAGYDQIVALYNWWQRASAAFGTPVHQYVISDTDQGDPNALAIPGGYLVRKADAAASGELIASGALASDPDQRLDVTGHSLGGHLAMAFGALFGASTASVTSFNSPGFGNNAHNQAFFGESGSGLAFCLPPSPEPDLSNRGGSTRRIGWIALLGRGDQPADV